MKQGIGLSIAIVAVSVFGSTGYVVGEENHEPEEELVLHDQGSQPTNRGVCGIDARFDMDTVGKGESLQTGPDPSILAHLGWIERIICATCGLRCYWHVLVDDYLGYIDCVNDCAGFDCFVSATSFGPDGILVAEPEMTDAGPHPARDLRDLGRMPFPVVTQTADRLSVRQSLKWTDDDGGEHVLLDLGEGRELVEFTVDQSSRAYIPTCVMGEHGVVRLWGTPDGLASLADYFHRSRAEGEDVLEPPLGIAALSDFTLPEGESFDAVSLIEVGRPATIILILWNSGEPVGVRFATGSGQGPTMGSGRGGFWHPSCCIIFRWLCSGCDDEYDDCMDGGNNPCHAFDRCCLVALLLSHLLHL